MTQQDFISATIEAIYFTDTGEDDQPSRDAEMADELRDRIEADCKSFWYRSHYHFEPAGLTDEQAGRDFWLTRNGHGVGFWDRDLNGRLPWRSRGNYGDLLTKLAESYGGIDTYQNDDGEIA
jgi:hypothetical protein